VQREIVANKQQSLESGRSNVKAKGQLVCLLELITWLQIMQIAKIVIISLPIAYKM